MIKLSSAFSKIFPFIPVIMGIYIAYLGLPMFWNAATVVELIKGLITTAFGIIFAIVGFFGIIAVFY